MRQWKWTAGLFAAIASLAGPAIAEAASIPITAVTPSELLADFNVIVDQNLSNMNEIEGPVLVGGNLKATGPLNASRVILGATAGTTAITGYGEVDVFGNVLAGTNASVMNSVTYIGGTNGGSILSPGAGSRLSGYAFPFGATAAMNAATFEDYIWDPLMSVSSNLGGMTSLSSFSISPMRVGTLTGAVNANGLAVFNLTVGELNSLTSIVLAGCLVNRGPCTAVINVTGAGAFQQRFAMPSGALSNMIFNFENTTTNPSTIPNVSLDNLWTASILDTVGSVNSIHIMTGNIVALNYTTTDELHLPGFDCKGSSCTAVPVPEPGAMPILGLALSALAVMRRRLPRTTIAGIRPPLACAGDPVNKRVSADG